ncbi:MAG: pyridoxamine 5'-phosphate oxidase family protein [Phycisphaeraceae bacterium]
MSKLDSRLRRAISVVDQNRVGLLCTCDDHAYPHARWMTAVSHDNLHTLQTLTARHTRKLEQLRHNDRVSWVFTSEAFGDIVQLIGRVSIDEEPIATQAAWDQLAQAVRQYVVGPTSDSTDLEMVVLNTKVERIELICPELGIRTPHQIAMI